MSGPRQGSHFSDVAAGNPIQQGPIMARHLPGDDPAQPDFPEKVGR